MTRIDKGALTKIEIVREATRQFLEKGYSNTTVSSIAKSLGMSQGNLTFHYPTKEHLLAELVDRLCDFQWKLMEKEADDGISSVLAVCLELATMVAASEHDEVIRDFFCSAYTSPMCLDIIRKNDTIRGKEVFRAYQPDWTDAQFDEAEVLVSGIEYATLMTAGNPVSLEMRVSAALNSILSIYGIPQEIRDAKIQKVFQKDYIALGERTLRDFREFVEEANDQAFDALLGR